MGSGFPPQRYQTGALPRPPAAGKVGSGRLVCRFEVPVRPVQGAGGSARVPPKAKKDSQVAIPGVLFLNLSSWRKDDFVKARNGPLSNNFKLKFKELKIQGDTTNLFPKDRLGAGLWRTDSFTGLLQGAKVNTIFCTPPPCRSCPTSQFNASRPIVRTRDLPLPGAFGHNAYLFPN